MPSWCGGRGGADSALAARRPPLAAGPVAPRARPRTIAAMEPTAPARSHRTWLRTLMIWTGVGLFQATQTVVSMRAMGMRHAWLELFVFLWLSWLPWALVTPLAMRLARRWPLWPLRAAACWRHALALLGSSLAATLWSATLEHALNPWNPLRPPVPVAWKTRHSTSSLSAAATC